MARGVCDVCRIVRNDTTEKEVSYCGFCKANICKECIHSPDRIRAFAKSKGFTYEQFVESLRSYLGRR